MAKLIIFIKLIFFCVIFYVVLHILNSYFVYPHALINKANEGEEFCMSDIYTFEFDAVKQQPHGSNYYVESPGGEKIYEIGYADYTIDRICFFKGDILVKVLEIDYNEIDFQGETFSADEVLVAQKNEYGAFNITKLGGDSDG